MTVRSKRLQHSIVKCRSKCYLIQKWSDWKICVLLENNLQFMASLQRRRLSVMLRQLSLLPKRWHCHCIALWQQEQTSDWWIFNDKVDVYLQWIICYSIVNKPLFLIQCLGLFKYSMYELCSQGRTAKVRVAWAANLVARIFIWWQWELSGSIFRVSMGVFVHQKINV